MKRIVLLFVSNLIALGVAAYFVAGFKVNAGYEGFLIAAAIFTLINLVIKPILKLVLSPIIIITLGVGAILVNVVVLYLLDFLTDYINIIGIDSLIYATLIITGVNFLTSFLRKI